MKKVLYAILLIVELIFACLSILLLWSNPFRIPCAIIVAVWVVLMVWQICMLTKAADAAAKQKIFRRIALVMAVPMIGLLILVIWFIVRFCTVT